MGKVPRKKRFKHRKRHKDRDDLKVQGDVKVDLLSVPDPCQLQEGLSDVNENTAPIFRTEPETTLTERIFTAVDGDTCDSSSCLVPSIDFHDYAHPPSMLKSNADCSKESGENTIFRNKVDTNLLLEVKKKMEMFMPNRWVPIVQQEKIHAVLISPHNNLSIQRSLEFSPDGTVDLNVHCEPINVDPYLKGVPPPVLLHQDSVDCFVDRCVTVVNNVKNYEICGGVDDAKFKAAWSSCPFGEIDRNPYRECRYTETFRSISCARLVNGRQWRCLECSNLYGPLLRRARSHTKEEVAINTGNKFLSEEQKLRKLEQQRRELDRTNKKIARLQQRMQQLLKKDGVQVDDLLSNDLTEILKSGSISPAHSIFLQQQVKASQKKNMAGMRWHPTMLRLALSLHLTSPAAYEMLRDTGMVKLPSSRTLFDYSHVKPAEEGIDKVVIESLSARVGKLKLEKNHKKYHVLMADEMHISQNLVFQKCSGRLVGYTSLDEVDAEVKKLEKYLDNPEEEVPETIASKVLTYMVKGISNGIKQVVATYAVGNLSANQLYIWTWKVIGALERSGIAIAVFVCDGCSVNRLFIKKHKPVTKLPSSVVFDTVNKAAPNRVLYFMSDVPHLLKTIRNCFSNSRSDKKKCRRKLIKNGKKISWDFIIRLFKAKKTKSLRQAFKLSAMNVFPDGFARMKVRYAAEILSRTVASALEREGWEGTEETVYFIRYVNDWFDCLNGAHSKMGKRKRNQYLHPYDSCEDFRFEFLRGFLKYLEEWQAEALNPDLTLNTTVGTNVTGNIDMTAAGSDESYCALAAEQFDSAKDETPASKRILSKQTLEGIEMTTQAFIHLVPFLLSEGVDFLNARVFTQDPLEQHFSKVRAGQGGSTNPNLGQVLNRNRAIHTIGQLGMKRRKGNTEVGYSHVEVTETPLPKRKCNRTPKFSN